MKIYEDMRNVGFISIINSIINSKLMGLDLKLIYKDGFLLQK